MSKILTWKETNEIANKMVTALGFSPVEVRLDNEAESGEQCTICDIIYKTKTVGKWWWKKEIEEKTYETIVSAYCFENALLKLEELLAGPAGQGRAEKADKIREKYATLLLDEKLEEDEEDA